MVSPYGIKLAVHLISTYFGDLVSKVCECLLRKGTLSLAQIIRFTELSKQNVTNSLLVLIQHNCVQAFTVQQPGGFIELPKPVTQYMALHDNIIHHMRFAKFLAIVSDEFGKECLDIFEGLLQHGRLSLNQIRDRHTAILTNGETTMAATALHENFNKLAQGRYIERCPVPEPVLAPPGEGDAPAKKRGSRTKLADGSDTLEARALAAAVPMASIRFLVETDTWSDDGPDGNCKDNLTTATAGEKRKLERLESETEDWATNKNNEVLWRVNFEEFVRRLRHKSCVAHVRARLDDAAGVVLSAILEASRKEETKVKMENSVSLSMNTIFEEVMKSEEGRSLTLERVRASLVQLGCELPAIEIDETYSIDLKKIIEQAQAQEVESIVLKKYGREAYRIFRLLLERECLYETDKIANTTFVEKKDAMKILFQLWKDDFLHMERLGNEYQNADILLWKLNKRSLWEQVLDDMYHAALNLKLRLRHELEQANDILRIPKGKPVGQDVEQQRKRIGNKWKVLESSFMILDDAIMLFNDF